jgi:D-amino-acid dehydrogenase
MARLDALVLGAGIVGTSIALHLAKRGLMVALVDRKAPGEETSFGNLGVIGGAGVYPAAFPRRLFKLIQVAFNRASESNYHLRFLPKAAPWLFAYFRHSSPQALEATARAMRPLMARAVAEHEALMGESGALRFLRKDGWISVYRTGRAYEALKPELALGAELGVAARLLDVDGALALEPSLLPAFRHAIHWPDIASVSNPLAVTQAYAKRFTDLGGIILQGDARSLERVAAEWRVNTSKGDVEAEDVVIALGPWAPDVLEPLGIRLPLGIKRGYHRHFRPRGNAALTRPVVDTEYGYGMSPMEQGIRLTTGAEFAARDAPATPVQFDRLMPHARELFPLGDAVEADPWLGKRPIFPDSRPVIGRAAGKPGLWLAYGHGHFGLSLGPATGRLLAEMMTGARPFCDPMPYSAERFRT